MTKFKSGIPRKSLWFRTALFLLVFARTFTMEAQISLNVTNFGARGDAVQIWVNTKKNSTQLTTTNQLSTADVGKTIELFGVGSPSIGINYLGNWSTNQQDMLAVITNVVNRTNIYI